MFDPITDHARIDLADPDPETSPRRASRFHATGRREVLADVLEY